MTPSETDRDENLALLREGIEAYNRRDLSFVIERAGDDIEVYAHPELLNTGTYRGREAFENWMREWQEAWAQITLDVRGAEAIGDNHILVDVGQSAIGVASGVPVEMDIFQLIEVSDGEIKRFHLYPNRETAMAALEMMQEEAL